MKKQESQNIDNMNFNLSNEIFRDRDKLWDTEKKIILNVEEFIRILKVELFLNFKNGFDSSDTINWLNKFDVEEVINKLAGEELNGTKD